MHRLNLFFEKALNLQMQSLQSNNAQKESAMRSIKAFQKSGVNFNFDPENQEQIRTYLQLKQISKRVTPGQIKAAMENQKSEVTSVGAMRFNYWGVPKSNFPDGLPAKIQASELPEDEAEDYMVMGGGTIDTSSYYIIDCEVQRSELGKNVVTFEFVTKNTTKRKLKDVVDAAAATPRLPAIKDKEESEGQASAADRTHLGRSAAGAGANAAVSTDLGRSLGRQGSEASDEQVQPDKQAKTMVSTLKILKESLFQAMDKGLWEAKHPLQRDNVKDLLDELIAVLLDLKTFKPAAEVSSLASKVARWLITEILGRPVFKHLHIFQCPCSIKKLLEGELAEGIDRSTCPDHFCFDMVKLIESMAATLLTESTEIDLNVASVTNRTTFRISILYQSFVNAKVDTSLAKAKETSGQARVNMVKECQHVTGLQDAVQFTIDTVIALFDETVPLYGRIGYMLDQNEDEQPRVLKLASDWDPNGVIGMAAMSLQEKADLTGKSYLTFEEFSGAAIKTVGGNMMCALFVLKRYRRNNKYIGN